MGTYGLDGLDVSKIADLLYLKVVVFIQAQEAYLLSISTETKEYEISLALCLQENNGTMCNLHQTTHNYPQPISYFKVTNNVFFRSVGKEQSKYISLIF